MKASKKMTFSNLSGEFKTFFYMHGIFMIGYTLSNVFISTFLFRIDNDFITVGKYYLITYIFQIIGQTFGINFLRKFKPSVLTRLGLTMYTLSFLVILLTRDKATEYILPIALLSGLGTANYYLPYHNYSKLYLNGENLQYGMSALGIIGNIINLLLPSISGWLISNLPGISGYFAVFATTTVLIICGMLISRSLPSEVVGGPKSPVISFFKNVVLKSKPLIMFYLAEVLFGTGLGVVNYYSTLLIYSKITSEFVIGIASSSRALAGILLLFLIRNVTDVKKKNRLMLIGAVITAAFFAVLMPYYSMVTILIYYFLYDLSGILNNNCGLLAMYDCMEGISMDGNPNYITITFREYSLNIGRMLGVILLLLAPPSVTNGLIVLFILSLLSVPGAILICLAQKKTQEQ